MNNTQISCEYGHYYMKSLGQCPICKSEGGGTVLIGIGNSSGAPQKRNIRTVEETNTSQPLVPKKRTVPTSDNIEKIDTAKTKYIQNTQESETDTTENQEEVILAGWLVIISKEGKGKSYDVTFGFNSIGRDKSNHIVLDIEDKSISREKHSSLIYDYNNNVYFLKHEDGKFLTYLNDEIVLETKKVSSYDKIKIGNTELLFIALCNDKFKWEV